MLNNEELLRSGLETLGIKNQENLTSNLLIYKDLLIKWNQTYNLTAIKDAEQIITHHLLDCLSIVKYIVAKNILDVGSGAGLPGLILALCFPERSITMVDKVGKKIAFIKQAAGELGIKNINVSHKRVEDMRPEVKFDGIIARAFSDMASLIELTYPLLDEGGHWYGMKSIKSKTDEMHLIHYPYQVEKIEVPCLVAERYLITVTKKTNL